MRLLSSNTDLISNVLVLKTKKISDSKNQKN